MITITVWINEVERDATEEVPVHWIQEQIANLTQVRRPICVRVRINGPEISVHLVTPGCSTAPGGGRPPRPREQELLDLWSRLGLNDAETEPRKVVPFLEQASRSLK